LSQFNLHLTASSATSFMTLKPLLKDLPSC
jgi:hypothetical protein